MIRHIRLLFLINLLISLSFFAQTKELTFEQAYLFSAPRLLKALPTLQTWTKDENSYLLVEGNNIKIVNLLSEKENTLLDYSELDKRIPDEFELKKSLAHTEDYSKFILSKDNDLYLFERVKNTFSKLTNDRYKEINPTFSPNAKFIAYTKNHNLYFFNLANLEEVQITDDGSDVVYNGYASWIYYEEILGRSSHYRAFYWSPDSKKISFLRFDDTKVPTFPLFNANGIHGELEITHYPKPGDPNPEVKLGVVNVDSKKINWIDNTIEKGNYIAWPIFTNDNNSLLYQRMNREQNKLELVLTNIKNNDKKVIYIETQPTWVEFIENLYMLKNDDSFLIKTEVNDWYHIYHYDLTGKLINQITNGNWNVNDIQFVDEETKTIYFHSRREKSTNKDLYKISFDGDNLERLTEGDGTHNCTVIPDGKFFFDKWSSINHPTKLVLYDLKSNKKTTIADSKTQEMDKYNLGKVELFTIPTEDGYDLPAKWFLPPDFDENKKYPVIFSIYGGPGIMSVSNSFPRRGLGNYYLAQNGIIIISVDNRGAGHFGKKAKNEMHRNLGKWEIDDLVSAAKWLRTKAFVDSNKIAITGGSYGGYTTSMALARASEYFKCGIAKYAVTDWRLYDNVYTERYMDTPKENPEGYKYASVMNHAETYNGGMLITHGSLDDNVHMQNTIQLIDVLEDLDKDFELMIYPNQRHGIRYPKYPHSMKVDVDFWFKHLLDK